MTYTTVFNRKEEACFVSALQECAPAQNSLSQAQPLSQLQAEEKLDTETCDCVLVSLFHDTGCLNTDCDKANNLSAFILQRVLQERRPGNKIKERRRKIH